MIKRIVKVNYGKTLNLGNYENVKIDVGVEVELNTKDDFEDSLNLLYSEMERFIEHKEKEIRREARR